MTRQRAYELRRIVEIASASLDDATALGAPELFAYWQDNTEYEVGDRRRDPETKLLYRCLQGHISQSNWYPSATPALWAQVAEPGEEWPEWIQPIGSTGLYSAGDKVSHDGTHWISNYDNNSWEPGIFGWSEA